MLYNENGKTCVSARIGGIALTKTNAMRLMEQAGISIRVCQYEVDESDLSGLHAAEQLNMPPEQIFKTLVARGDKTGICVFCIPVCCELDLKKAAKISKNKKVEMIHVRELLGLTGYVRGGCSPVGMKKQYPTYIEEAAALYDEIGVSAGARGVQMLLSPEALIGYCRMTPADLIE